jgi:hypothetical protein
MMASQSQGHLRANPAGFSRAGYAQRFAAAAEIASNVRTMPISYR